jgi:hypothetical protein
MTGPAALNEVCEIFQRRVPTMAAKPPADRAISGVLKARRHLVESVSASTAALLPIRPRNGVGRCVRARPRRPQASDSRHGRRGPEGLIIAVCETLTSMGDPAGTP